MVYHREREWIISKGWTGPCEDLHILIYFPMYFFVCALYLKGSNAIAYLKSMLLIQSSVYASR